MCRNLACSLVLILVGWANSVSAAPQPVSGVAAIVNQTVITTEDIEMYAEIAMRTVARQFSGRPEEWARKRRDLVNEAREDLIDRQLILDEFKSKGYAMPDSVVEEFVKRQTRRVFGDNVNLIRHLQETGQTKEDFRRQMKEDIIIGEMRNKNIGSQITISPKKIEAFYQTNQARFKVNEQVKLRMIILNEGKRPEGEAQKVARDIVAKVRAGGKFSELASSFSDDAARNRGGDRGWVEDRESDLRKELREVLFALAKGAVSDPVVIDGNVFVLYSEDRKSAGLRPLNDVRNEIESALKAEEFDRLSKNWTKRLREKAFVRYF